MKNVTFCGFDCGVYFHRYADNDNIAIQLANEEEGPVATASVNLGKTLPDNMVMIKNWSENQGILDVLVEAGIVEDTGETVQSGFVEANLCKLLVDPTE